MPSRMMVRGRYTVASADARGAMAFRPGLALPAARAAVEVQEFVPLPGGEKPSPGVGGVFIDPKHGIEFRIIQRASPAEGWVAAPTILGWYKTNYAQLVEWVKMGWVATALEVGSPTKRFMVVEPNKILRSRSAKR